MVISLLGNKFILLVTGRKQVRFLIIVAAVLAFLLINTVIFTNLGSNPLENKSVIIDPGHGGIDGGTNDGSTFFEKDINLQISQKLQSLLENKNAGADLTRDSDISLDDRNNLSSSRHTRDLLARVMQFNSGKYDLFISIHVNRSSNSRAIGPMTLYSSRIPQSTVLAECVQDSLNMHMKNYLKRDIARRPIKSDFFVLRRSNIPGIIIETGFISNAAEKKLLQEEEYQWQLAEAIFTGIKNYFKSSNTPDITNTPAGDDGDIPFNIINEVRLVEK